MMAQGLHVEVFGEGADPLVLLPGGGVRDPIYIGDVRTWQTTRPVAVVHYRGTPASGGLPRPWWDQFDDLEEVRRRLALDVVDLVAHSSGSRVALAYAASDAPVRRIALITPPATWLTGSEDDIAELVAKRPHTPPLAAALLAPPLSLTSEETFREHQELTAPLGYASWTDDAQNHSRTGSTDIAALRAFFGAPPPAELLPHIRSLAIPIHVIAGAEDLLSGYRPVLELAATFTRGTVETIEGSGHYPWIDQPTAFAAALEAWVRNA